MNARITASAKRYRYTGLYFHGARYYACWQGRWTASDPMGLGDGVNRFTYVSGNPVVFSDPSGQAGEYACGTNPDGTTVLCADPPGAAYSRAPLGKSVAIEEATLMFERGGRVCRVFTTRVSQWLRRAAKRTHRRAPVNGLHAGVITVIPRVRSDLGLYLHLHCLVTDGVFEAPACRGASPTSLSVPQPEPEDLVAILRGAAYDSDPRLAHWSDDEVDPGIAACVQLGLDTRSQRLARSRSATRKTQRARVRDEPARRHNGRRS